MRFSPLPFTSPAAVYRQQARDLLEAHKAGDAGAVEIFHRRHPRFLDSEIVWLPKELPEAEIREAVLTERDAELAVARCYNFRDWAALEGYAEAVNLPDSPVFRFEAAIESVIGGDLDRLRDLLREDAGLVRARSTRVTNFDPPVHRATLLHYVAANGVEGYRQKTPPNAVEVARVLLRAGADVDALADMYGEPCTTMCMLASSSPPAEAGLQVALIETLLDGGASVDGRQDTKWGSPLATALVFGFRDAAEALVRRGAGIDNVALAAGLGRRDETARLLESADELSRHRALALAAQHGYAEVVRLLLDAGEDPDRFNPEGHHKHSTPLHQAALAGHMAVVRLLVERGTRLDLKDKIYHSTPLGWARHGGQTEVAEYLACEKCGG